MAAEEVLLTAPASDSPASRRPPGRMTRVNSASTTRCSARPTPRSAPKRAACTSARAWRSCCRCRRPSRSHATSSSRRRFPAQTQKDEDVAVRRRRHASRAWRSSPARRAPKELDRRADGDLRRRRRPRRRASTRSSDEATLKPLLDGLFAVRALRGELRGMPIDESAKVRNRFPAAAEGARVPAGDRCSPTASGSKRSPTMASSCPGQQVKVSVIVANRGSGDVAVKQVKFEGFEGDAACAMTAVTGGGFGFPAAGVAAAAPTRRRAPPMSSAEEGSGRAMRADADRFRRRASQRAVLAPRGRGRTLHVRRRRAVRPADRPTPFYVQVTIGLPGGEEVITACRCRTATKATSSAARSGPSCWSCRLVGARLAGDRDHSGRIDPPARLRRRRTARPRRRRRHAASAPRPHAAAGATSGARRPPRRRSRGPRDRRQRHAGRGGERRDARAAAGLDATPPEQPVKFARPDESQTVRFQVKPAPNTRGGRIPRPRDRGGERREVRSRLPGDRVPAHPPVSHLRPARHDAEGDRRQDAAPNLRWATSWASATRCRRRSSSSARRSR